MKSFTTGLLLGCGMWFSLSAAGLVAQENQRRETRELAAQAEKKIRGGLEELKKMHGELQTAREKGQQERVAELERKFAVLEAQLAEKKLSLRYREQLEAERREAEHRGEGRDITRSDPEEKNPERREPVEFERRLRHLREAAENLEQGGFPDLAHQLHRQAEIMMAQHAQQAERERRPGNPELGELHQIIRHQNERIEKLEHAVRELMEVVTDLRKRAEN